MSITHEYEITDEDLHERLSDAINALQPGHRTYWNRLHGLEFGFTQRIPTEPKQMVRMGRRFLEFVSFVFENIVPKDDDPLMDACFGLELSLDEYENERRQPEEKPAPPEPGDRLPNGAIAIDTARNQWGEMFVLALKTDGVHTEYVTWGVPDDDPRRTCHGHYYETLTEGVQSLKDRTGG